MVVIAISKQQGSAGSKDNEIERSVFLTANSET